MKKAISLILVLMMLFTVVACNGSPAPSESPSSAAPSSAAPSAAAPSAEASAPSASGPAYPNCNPDGSINLDTIAHYDRDYDYTQNPVYKIAYMSHGPGALYQQSADAYEHLAGLFNCEWAGYVTGNEDTSLFLSLLENQCDQGVNAFILDPDDTIFPSIIAVIEKYPGVQWMSMNATPRDNAVGDGIPPGGNMLNPSVGFNNYDAGVQCTKQLMEWKDANFPDVPWDEVGFIAISFSIFTQLRQRAEGAWDIWCEEGPGTEANFFVADAVAGGINVQSGIDIITPILTTNTQYTHWLVMGNLDDLALGAAQVIDQMGYSDTSCVNTFGGSALQMQWDAGQQNAFRYALYAQQKLYGEPIIGALYAFLNGWATKDNIWPSWVRYDDHGIDGHTYSQLLVPTVWLDFDNYKHYLKWTDMYALANAYPEYPAEGISINDYSPFIDVPDYYHAP